MILFGDGDTSKKKIYWDTFEIDLSIVRQIGAEE